MCQFPPPTTLSILTSISRSSVCASPHTVIWDIQIGMIIRDITTWNLGKIVFSKDQTSITIITRFNFYVYGFGGELICEGELGPSFDHELVGHWVDEKSLLFAIRSGANEDLMITIQELQPTLDPPLMVVRSFPISPQDGEICFSPLSFHASFASGDEIVILDVRDSKVLFQTEDLGYSWPEACFSPDGHFFAYREVSHKLDIWENSPTGYVHWGTLRARSWEEFSWSPTSVSILCWGSSGIQLLHLDNSLDSTPLKEMKGAPANHLVAYPADQAYVATTWESGHIITVLNLSNGTQLSIDTKMPIFDMKIFGNTIFVASGTILSSWHLTTGGQVDSTGSIRRDKKALYAHMGRTSVLSNDCSQIAFSIDGTVFLYDVEAKKVLDSLTTDGGDVTHMQFSYNGCQLWVVSYHRRSERYKCYCVELEMAKNPCFGNVTMMDLEGEQSLEALLQSPHEYRIVGSGSEWVSDSRGNLLWLSPNWRSKFGLKAKWNGNFLSLVGYEHPEPIIIEFQS